ncbi:MAG TPA: DUF3300 domain-containing protein [Candidatus Sulfotelmatobacter sp.]|nr:DUF3300 domain-containing protein [Candidatus Sulfotelmatobacter sp.]
MSVFKKLASNCIATILAVSLLIPVAYAQDQQAPPPPPYQGQDQGQDQAPPPSYAPEQLDNMVSRIALYPDPLLAQVLTASTFGDQIPDAARWSDEHHYLNGQQLSDAINQDQLPWDPSVLALLPFPSVLDMMASEINWTNDLGNAVLAQRPDVMDAVQRERHRAYQYGYLRTNPQIVVSNGPYIDIEPVNPAFIIVPAYNPVVVFAPPRPGFFVGGAIGFGFGVAIGSYFRPWGWGTSHFVWGSHVVIVNNRPWGRTWVNRRVYVHPYEVRRYGGPGVARAEHHELIQRSEHERAEVRAGHAHVEEHEHHH